MYMVHFDDLNADLDYDDQTETLFASFAYTLDSRGNRIASSDVIDGGRKGDILNYESRIRRMSPFPPPLFCSLHPGGQGGYSIWAIPAGAPENY